MKSMFLAVLSLCCCPIWSASQDLLRVEPPFASQEIIQVVPNLKLIGEGEDADYIITSGDHVLNMHDTNRLGVNLTVAGQPKWVMQFHYWGSTAQGGYGNPFDGETPRLTRVSDKSVTVEKKFHAASKHRLDGEFAQNIAIQDDGLISVRYRYRMPSGASQVNGGLHFNFRPELAAGMTLTIDDQPYRITGQPISPSSETIYKGRARKLVFWPDKPMQTFTVEFHERVAINFFEREDPNRPGRMQIQLRVDPERDGSTGFRLDIRNASAESTRTDEMAEGINFWKNDRLNIPDFNASRNLLPNPSFESGLRYFDLYSIWGDWPGRDYPTYALYEDDAKLGNQSLKITNWTDYTRPNWLSTFTIPTEAGQTYVFSFYAKGLTEGQQLELMCVSGNWGVFPTLTRNSVSLTDEWQRYSTTFTAPNRAAIMLIKLNNSGDRSEGSALVDAMQLEKADKPTDFVDETLGTDLLTSDPDNFLSPGQKFDTRLVVNHEPNVKGTVEYELLDLFYHTKAQGQAEFRTDADGRATIPLLIEDNIGTGVFVLRADYRYGDKTHADFYRLSSLTPLTEDIKHRNIFSGSAQARINRSEALVKRYADLGFGSNPYQDSIEEHDLFAKYGIHDTGSGVFDYGPKGGEALSARRQAVWKRLASEPYSDELAAEVEIIAYEMVRAHPWIETWFLQAECNGGGGKLQVVRDRDYEGFAKFIIACAEGIRRADPDARLMLTGGPTNMSPGNGIRYVEQTAKNVRALAPDLEFDAIAAHPYRPTPENPDLDSDTATFLEMLDQNGFGDTQIYWNEGIYNNPYQVAEWKLDPHKGCSTDHWRCGTPTYDMGWGERISAAYYARSWLVALKYADRVAQYDGWFGNTLTIDTRLTPLAVQKVPHTLATLLGNAAFKRDVRFAPNCRVYVFEYDQRRPVAAMWSHIPMVDRGFEPSPTAVVELGDWAPEFFDLMGNRVELEVSADGQVSLPVSPFPVFIRGEAGSTEALIGALESTRLTDSNESALALSVRPVSTDAIEVAFTNQLSYPFEGRVRVEAGGKPVEHDTRLEGLETEKVEVALSQPLRADRINRVELAATVSRTDEASIDENLGFSVMLAHHRDQFTIDGDLQDWDGIPAIELSNAINYRAGAGAERQPPRAFTAMYRLAWSDTHLYLCVEVIDPTPYFPSLKAPGQIYLSDSVQLYIDTFGDNAEREVKQTFDFNDYEYDISKQGQNGDVIVYRRVAPEQQIAGGLDAPKPDMIEPDVEASVVMTNQGYVYEAAFPRRLIAPLSLEESTCFRLGLTVNDGDDAGRQWNLNNLFTPGADPFSLPEAWPMVFTIGAP